VRRSCGRRARATRPWNEVWSLVAAQQQAESFLESPAIELAAATSTQPGLAGQTGSHYDLFIAIAYHECATLREK
jgi:hypothetical protein